MLNISYQMVSVAIGSRYNYYLSILNLPTRLDSCRDMMIEIVKYYIGVVARVVASQQGRGHLV